MTAHHAHRPGPAAVEMPDDIVEFNDEALRRGWGDGFPLIPPTEKRVEAMLAGVAWRKPDEVLGIIPPRTAEATVERIAINAVMAGCLPAAMPVLLAAVQAMCVPAAGLLTAQATTHGGGMMLLVSGPVADLVEMHGGAGVFGPGFRGNATIGRAIRLILQNIGGAYPGTTDRSTQGSAAKYSFAFCENEAESPWDPYRVSLGYAREVSTVTVMMADPPQSIMDGVSTTAGGLMLTFCSSIAGVGKNASYLPGGEYFVVFCPEHAALLARFDFSRRDVQEYLFARARIPYRIWKDRGAAPMFINVQPKYVQHADDDMGVPMSVDPEKIQVIVAGGAGIHSAWFGSVGGITRASTTVIDQGP